MGKGAEESGRVARCRGRGGYDAAFDCLAISISSQKDQNSPPAKEKGDELIRCTDLKSTQFVFCFNFTACGVSLEPV